MTTDAAVEERTPRARAPIDREEAIEGRRGARARRVVEHPSARGTVEGGRGCWALIIAGTSPPGASGAAVSNPTGNLRKISETPAEPLGRDLVRRTSRGAGARHNRTRVDDRRHARHDVERPGARTAQVRPPTPRIVAPLHSPSPPRIRPLSSPQRCWLTRRSRSTTGRFSCPRRPPRRPSSRS